MLLGYGVLRVDHDICFCRELLYLLAGFFTDGVPFETKVSYDSPRDYRLLLACAVVAIVMASVVTVPVVFLKQLRAADVEGLTLKNSITFDSGAAQE